MLVAATGPWSRATNTSRTDAFNIRLWFAGVSLVVVAVIAAAAADAMTRLLTGRLLHREAEVSQEFLQSIVRAEGSGDRIFEPGRGGDALRSFVGHIESMPGVLRANVYGRDRVVLWSTSADLVGRVFTANPELDAAFGGALATEVGRINERMRKPEHEALAGEVTEHFIEAYIPIRDAAGAVAGVVELYKSPEALDAAIRSGRVMVWIWAACAAALLYAALYGIASRAARVMQRQQARLTEMETLAAIGQTASAIAHSLRNPLAAVRSSAELLALTGPATAREASAEIVAEVDRMDRHVGDLLRYASSGSAALVPVDPLEVARACLVDAQGELQRRGIRAEVVDRRTGPRSIVADPTLLSQAVASLVSNAAEATPHGGTLRIVADAGPGDAVALMIEDSGRGMPADVLAQASQPFFTTKARGLGLGLSLARRIVERFGGTLTIDSAPGRGTRVRLAFPAGA